MELGGLTEMKYVLLYSILNQTTSSSEYLVYMIKLYFHLCNKLLKRKVH